MLKYLLAGLLCLAPTLARAAAPPDPAWLPEAERLIALLANRDHRVYEDAERRLHALGPKVLPLLHRAVNHRVHDVRRRALRLAPLIETSALLAPRRVTLRVEKKSLKFILDETSRQTGYKLQALNVDAEKSLHTFNLDNVTFWEAVDRICLAANLTVQTGWGDDVVRLMPQPAPNSFTGRDGAFRYTGLNFNLSRSVSLTPSRPGALLDRSESLNFNFLLFAEPKLPFMRLGEVVLDCAYDDQKESMLVRAADVPPGARFHTRHYHNQRQLSLHASVPLARGSAKATTLKLLRGSVGAVLLVEQQPVVLSQLVLTAKGTTVRVDDVSFRFDDVTTTPDGNCQVKLTITNANADGDFTWMHTLGQRLELQSVTGMKYQLWGQNWHSNAAGQTQITFTWSPNGLVGRGPARLVFQNWRTRHHHIAFEFRDVPLP